jgi:hypothetical protein
MGCEEADPGAFGDERGIFLSIVDQKDCPHFFISMKAGSKMNPKLECIYCGLVVIKAGKAVPCSFSTDLLPYFTGTTRLKLTIDKQTFFVLTDIMKFENVANSKELPDRENTSILCCADCDKGPIGINLKKDGKIIICLESMKSVE